MTRSKTLRLKHLCTRSSEYGANEPAENYVEHGVRFLRTTDIDDLGRLSPLDRGVFLPRAALEKYLLDTGDLLLSRSGTIGRSFLYSSDEHGPCGYAGYLVRYRPKATVHPRFLFYWTKTQLFGEEVAASSIQTTIQNFNAQKFANMFVPVLPRELQDRVVVFLDRKTAAIDALIAKKERLIEHLQEKRQALITQAVTKGLDPSVPKKESGSPVLGTIPAHWSMKRLKHVVARLVDCPHSTPEYEDDGPALVVRTADIDWGRLRIEQMRRCSLSTYAERSERMTLCAGDVMYSREGERFGMAAIVPVGHQLCLGQRMMAFRPNRQTDARFLAWALNSSVSYVQVTQDTVGATSPRVNIPTVANLLLAYPALDEQREIASFIEGATKHIDRMSDTTRSSIERLREYREALITAAVTGKIDVTKPEAA